MPISLEDAVTVCLITFQPTGFQSTHMTRNDLFVLVDALHRISSAKKFKKFSLRMVVVVVN